jgi:hypothetical protein
MWWMNDPERLKREVGAIGSLLEREAWLVRAEPRLLKALGFAYDIDIDVNGETFLLTLVFPAFFPTPPPLVLPRDGRRLSQHQYGDGGELCLEYRSDNWEPSITGAMMIESAYRLLSGERPGSADPGNVPSAHQSSLGQRLRGRPCRFLLTPSFMAHVADLPIGSCRSASVIEVLAARRTLVGHVARMGPEDAPEWREPGIPDRGSKGEAGTVLRLASLKDVPSSPDRETLNRIVFSAAGALGVAFASGDAAGRFLVLADNSAARMFYADPEDSGGSVLAHQPVNLSDGDFGGRLPESHASLLQKKVGIVGCGSLGSKIATSLARSGVGAFVLVDDDILKPGNLVRHDLDAGSLGAHKADALEARLKAVAVGVAVTARRVALGGQESSGRAASVLDELAACDLLIDATADPQAFNFVASVAREALRPVIWAEVYAGGIGGFVARLRPGFEPPPHAARRQYLAWCHQQGVPWQGRDREYGSHGSSEQPLLADDADVTVIAAHAARMALDLLARPDATIFTHPAYVIGLSREWIFEAPFDTRPIDFVAEGDWRPEPSAERTGAAIEFLSSLFDEAGDASRTGT